MEEVSRVNCIQGYHICMCTDIWDAVIGEVLACERESHNVEDCYAVAVKKIEGIIEHLPQICQEYVHCSYDEEA